MLSPLTGVVDAATADSEAARKFSMMVDAFLSDAPRFLLYRAEITQTLTDWQTSALSLAPMIDRSPALKEIRPLARSLSNISTAGLEAVSYLKLQSAPSTEWRQLHLTRLEEAAKPNAALEFAVIPSLRKLVIASAELPQLRSSTAAEWQKQINKLANPAK